MKIFFRLGTIIFFLFFSVSCIKQKTLRELKNQQIRDYILASGLDFDTLNSGVICHSIFRGVGDNFIDGQKVRLVFSGEYLDPNNSDKVFKFADQDTFMFEIGDREILSAWNDLALHFAPGGSGIAIFPYNIAYGANETPNIPANSTLVYHFRFLSADYRTDQLSLFWQYRQAYDSIANTFADTVTYVKYFDGQGNSVGNGGAAIEYKLYTIEDSLVAWSDSIYVDFSSSKYPKGLLEVLPHMNEGEMGQIILPPDKSYVSSNIFNLRPYTSLFYIVRIISTDHKIEQKSKINEFLYVNKLKPDTVLSTGIYYFKNKLGSGNYPVYGNTITLSDSLFLINTNISVSSCLNCTKVLNSTNFLQGQIEAIKLLKEGGQGIFIIPYEQAYGASSHGAVRPYSTLVYKVELDRID
jgi:FKBP-type peptidyl-prolyl cis-trans isomerase